MKDQKVGDVHVARLVEMEGPMFPASLMLPDWNEEILGRHRHWIEPGHYDPKTQNFIIAIQSHIVRTHKHTILVDTCVGNHKTRNIAPAWNNLDLPWLKNLKGKGVAPEEVDYVLCTHLHIDHVGWNTRLLNGRWVPTFPNAKYIISRTDFDHWGKDKESWVIDGSYDDSVLPIVEAGQAMFVDDKGFALDDEAWVEPSPGHTPGHLSLRVKSNGMGALFVGDALHHPVQVYHPELHNGADVDPDLARKTRRAILESLADTDQLMLPSHFASPSGGRVKGAAKGFAWEWVK